MFSKNCETFKYYPDKDKEFVMPLRYDFSNIQAVLKKTAHAITLLLMTQMEKIYRKRNDSKNPTNLSEHIIFIPSTHLWAMGFC
jgi:hypothetical protein